MCPLPLEPGRASDRLALEVTLSDFRGCGLKGYGASISCGNPTLEPWTTTKQSHCSAATMPGGSSSRVHGQRTHGEALRTHEERGICIAPSGPAAAPNWLQPRVGAQNKAVRTLMFGDHTGDRAPHFSSSQDRAHTQPHPDNSRAGRPTLVQTTKRGKVKEMTQQTFLPCFVHGHMLLSLLLSTQQTVAAAHSEPTAVPHKDGEALALAVHSSRPGGVDTEVKEP